MLRSSSRVTTGFDAGFPSPGVVAVHGRLCCRSESCREAHWWKLFVAYPATRASQPDDDLLGRSQHHACGSVEGTRCLSLERCRCALDHHSPTVPLCDLLRGTCLWLFSQSRRFILFAKPQPSFQTLPEYESHDTSDEHRGPEYDCRCYQAYRCRAWSRRLRGQSF